MAYEYIDELGQVTMVSPVFRQVAAGVTSFAPETQPAEEGPTGLTVAIVAGLGILLVGGGSFVAYKVIKGRKTKAAPA